MRLNETKDFILQKLSKELPHHLIYHSVEHTKDVFAACQYLAEQEGIINEQLDLLLTAALFHDSGFIYRSKGHEESSCDIAKQYLPGFQYSADQINVICNMILATKIPQSPKNKLEQILCD